ncbi:hypothetical protein Q7F05_15245 [Pseudomonas sp. Lb2C1-1]|uniref:hypothetical protein n=1 Tax=Pseudomonas TaxID=286 RepID=UPI00391A36D6
MKKPASDRRFFYLCKTPPTPQGFYAFLQLWTTILSPCETATQSRRKQLFCHGFDLSPFAVELAVGNVGVAGCKPLNTWLAGLWLFFEQAFFVKRE